jgi:hypothetical protein
MIATFKYSLPDELYVEGVSGKLQKTFTYDGPETFDVQIDQSGNIVDIDIQNDPELGPDYRKTINAAEQPVVAYMFAHYFDENYTVPLSETVDEVMENGDVYKKPVNPDLKDAYELFYNFEEEKWELKQILKELFDPAVPIVKERKEYVLKYFETFDFTEEIQSKIKEYLQILQNIIDNPEPLKTWKYINFPKRDIPKIPLEIAAEFAKVLEPKVEV